MMNVDTFKIKMDGDVEYPVREEQKEIDLKPAAIQFQAEDYSLTISTCEEDSTAPKEEELSRSNTEISSSCNSPTQEAKLTSPVITKEHYRSDQHHTNSCNEEASSFGAGCSKYRVNRCESRNSSAEVDLSQSHFNRFDEGSSAEVAISKCQVSKCDGNSSSEVNLAKHQVTRRDKTSSAELDLSMYQVGRCDSGNLSVESGFSKCWICNQLLNVSKKETHVCVLYRETIKIYCKNCEGSLDPSSTGNVPTSNIVFACSQCEENFKSLFSFLPHNCKDIVGKVSIGCDICKGKIGKADDISWAKANEALIYYNRANQSDTTSVCSNSNSGFLITDPKSPNRKPITSSEEKVLVNSKRKSLKCEFCGKAFKFKHHLEQHIEEQVKDGGSACNICDKVFKAQCLLEDHVCTHSENKRTKCNICNKILRHKRYLKIHKNRHKIGNCYFCNICYHIFTSELQIRNHFQEHREGEFQNSELAKCGLCGNSFSDLSALKDHLKQHSDGRQLKCVVCEKFFTKADDLKVHTLQHQNDLLLRCDICFLKFENSSELKKHLANCRKASDLSFSSIPPNQSGCTTVTSSVKSSQNKTADVVKSSRNKLTGAVKYSQNELQCTVCEKVFKDKQKLNRHYLEVCKVNQSHVKRKKIKCKICGKVFKREENLKAHARLHDNIQLFKCDICPRKFESASKQKLHSLKHFTKGIVKCGVCPRTFPYQSKLDEHMTLHTKQKPFNCDDCGKGFTRMSSLKAHLRVHSGIKPFRCDICKMAFARQGTLDRHVRTHSGEKPFKCYDCNKTFQRLFTLTQHAQLHLRNETN